MIGKRVRWRHLNQDGKPVLPDACGVVLQVAKGTANEWSVLLQRDDGTFGAYLAPDLVEVGLFERVAEAAPVPSGIMLGNPDDDPHEADCERALEKTIRDLGLWEDNGTCAGMQASVLLNDFMSELRAKDADLKKAEEELEKLKKKKSKAEPKKEETP